MSRPATFAHLRVAILFISTAGRAVISHHALPHFPTQRQAPAAWSLSPRRPRSGHGNARPLTGGRAGCCDVTPKSRWSLYSIPQSLRKFALPIFSLSLSLYGRQRPFPARPTQTSAPFPPTQRPGLPAWPRSTSYLPDASVFCPLPSDLHGRPTAAGGAGSSVRSVPARARQPAGGCIARRARETANPPASALSCPSPASDERARPRGSR